MTGPPGFEGNCGVSRNVQPEGKAEVINGCPEASTTANTTWAGDMGSSPTSIAPAPEPSGAGAATSFDNPPRFT